MTDFERKAYRIGMYIENLEHGEEQSALQETLLMMLDLIKELKE